jgi:hypothetical protein
MPLERTAKFVYSPNDGALSETTSGTQLFKLQIARQMMIVTNILVETNTHGLPMSGSGVPRFICGIISVVYFILTTD